MFPHKPMNMAPKVQAPLGVPPQPQMYPVPAGQPLGPHGYGMPPPMTLSTFPLPPGPAAPIMSGPIIGTSFAIPHGVPRAYHGPMPTVAPIPTMAPGALVPVPDHMSYTSSTSGVQSQQPTKREGAVVAKHLKDGTLVIPPEHYPTADGFSSPYEMLESNVNRNPYFKSYYDLPFSLRESVNPPEDFVVLETQPELQYVLTGPVAEEPYFKPTSGNLIEFQKFRIQVWAQREEELKDNGPACHIGEILLFDDQGARIDTTSGMTQANCPGIGICEDDFEANRVLEPDFGTKWLVREFGHFPVELEIDLGERRTLGAYAWRTANDTLGRDPISWNFQILTKHGWATLDEATDYPVPKARNTVVGPFKLGLGHDPQVFDEPWQDPAEDVSVPDSQPEPPRPEFNDVATNYLRDLVAIGSADHYYERVEELLRKGADPNATDSMHKTTFIKACSKPDGAVLQSLIDAKADLNAQAKSGESGLHRLALLGDVRAMELVLNAGAEPNLQDGQGDTPLNVAVGNTDPTCVGLLLSYGARPDIPDASDRIPLHILEDSTRLAGAITPAASECRNMLLNAMYELEQQQHAPSY